MRYRRPDGSFGEPVEVPCEHTDFKENTLYSGEPEIRTVVTYSDTQTFEYGACVDRTPKSLNLEDHGFVGPYRLRPRGIHISQIAIPNRRHAALNHFVTTVVRRHIPEH